MLNDDQWAGDYLSAGILFIRTDVRNFGPEDLYRRLLFEDFEETMPGPPLNLALSAEPVFVPAGSDWTTIRFPITPADLVVETFGTAAGALSDTDSLRSSTIPSPRFRDQGWEFLQ